MTVIDVYQTWQALLQLVNVSQNGQIPPTAFLTWYNEVNKQVFKELVDQYQTNQVMSDLLSPFNNYRLIQVATQPGQNWGLCSYPDGYQYFISATILTQQQEDECFSDSKFPAIDGSGKSKRYTDPDYAQMAVNYAGANISEGQLQVVDSARWAGCMESKTKPPKLTSPKMTQFGKGFKVAPKGVISVLLQYLSTPQDATFVYTISNDDILIYNSSASQQLQWSDQVLPWFKAFLVIKYGTYINDEGIVKMGESMLAMVKNK